MSTLERMERILVNIIIIILAILIISLGGIVILSIMNNGIINKLQLTIYYIIDVILISLTIILYRLLNYKKESLRNEINEETTHQ